MSHDFITDAFNTLSQSNELMALKAENARLQAEVARLNSLIANSEHENARLQAEVDKLKRAGDLMLKYASANMPYPPYVTIAKDWYAAKGVQS